MAALFKLHRRRVSLPALLTLVAAPGCFPVGWLPDSSGFVYTSGGSFDRLIHYDLASGKSRVLVERMPASTSVVAVSPDGKRVAVAHLRPGAERGKRDTVQVLMYDLQGKLVHRSAEFDWGPARRSGRDKLAVTGVFWAERADVLIVCDYEEAGRTGLYDLKKDTMRDVLEGTPCPYGGTPVRPDGKGFLVAASLPPAVADPEVFLVDWTGKKQRVALKCEIKGGDPYPEAALDLLFFPWQGTSEWDGHVARVTSGAMRIRIDTEKRTGVIDELRREDATVDGKELVQRYSFARGGLQLRVVRAGKPENPADPAAERDGEVQLELIRPGEKTPRVLPKIRNAACSLSPSPDGKWVAVRAGADSTHPNEVVLVSEAGEVRTIPREKKK